MLEIRTGEDFLFTDSGLYTCRLAVMTENGVFPDEEWNDFAGVVLKWWSDAVLQRAACEGALFELLFMDGPYRICGRREGENVRLRILRDDREMLPAQTIPYGELVQALLRGVRRLKSGLSRMGRREEAARTDELLLRLKKAAGSE